jgi:tetratricopeptide (TPR) repeat protein
MGAVYMEQDQFEKAVSCFRHSAELAQQIGDYQSQLLSLNNMGTAYTDMGEWDLAETCSRNSLLLSQELEDQYGLARAYNNLGALTAHRGQREEAIDYYKKAADAANVIGHLYRETMTLTNIASLYAQLYQPEMSELYFERAWSIAEAQNYHDQLAALCTLRGDTAFAQQETYSDAFLWFVQACQYAIRHSPQTLQKITQHITAHLQRLKRREYHWAARAFSLALLQAWQNEILQSQQPEFVARLEAISAED